eukprot:TRINITY_DN11736_c0_g2_i1.p1 TRINITY_DN11736_c0_g2~~TRINITY_DN11736_c0_g2_i1.p1  ORF type:complete len:654 (-),score=46.77 TRINITY_DN11736_c0_g2_i1:1277-3238(-)
MLSRQNSRQQVTTIILAFIILVCLCVDLDAYDTDRVCGLSRITGASFWTVVPNVWKVRKVEVNCTPQVQDMKVFWGPDDQTVDEKVEDGDAISFCGLENWIKGKQNVCQFQLSPFSDGVIEVMGKPSWLSAAGTGAECFIEEELSFTPTMPICTLIGLFLFWLAPFLVHSQVFRLSIGSATFVLGSIILVMFLFFRYTQGRKIVMGFTLLGLSYTVGRLFLLWVLDSFFSMVLNPLFIGYVVVCGLIGLAVTYYFDRPEDAKLNKIFECFLQLVGLFCLFHGFSNVVVSLAMCTVVFVLKQTEAWKVVEYVLDWFAEEESEKILEQEYSHREVSSNQNVGPEVERDGLAYLQQQQIPYISPPGSRLGYSPLTKQYRSSDKKQKQHMDSDNYQFYTPKTKKPFAFSKKDDDNEQLGNNSGTPYLLRSRLNFDEGVSHKLTPIDHHEQEQPQPLNRTSASSTRIRRERIRLGDTSGFVQGVEVPSNDEKDERYSSTQTHPAHDPLADFRETTPSAPQLQQQQLQYQYLQAGFGAQQRQNLSQSQFQQQQQQQWSNVGAAHVLATPPRQRSQLSDYGGRQSRKQAQQQLSEYSVGRQTRSASKQYVSYVSDSDQVQYVNMMTGRKVNKDGPTYKKLVSQGCVIDHDKRTISSPGNY